MQNRSLSIIALALAAVALAHSIWDHQHAAALADQAMRRREAQLVAPLAPGVARVCQDFGMNLDPATFHPTTIEELAVPMVALIDKVSSGRAETQPANAK